MKKKILIFVLTLLYNGMANAIEWFDGKQPVSYCIKTKTAPVVDIALQMFDSDMLQVTGLKPTALRNAQIEIYELDKASAHIIKNLSAKGIPTQRIVKEKDCFYLGVKNETIIIVGNNGRGCAYGILELSRNAGVSPWVWWGDVTPERKKYLSLADNYETCQSPSVEYRGIFLNDEDWTIRNWSGVGFDPSQPYGSIGPKVYKRIFELMLRLRANAIWPGMHTGTTAFFKVDGNREMADSCGIIVGSSHCEPLLRNNVDEWDESKRGAYNFITNRKEVENYWIERLKEVKGGEYFFTIGMRGIHDGDMQGVKTKKEKLEGLQAVIDCQRDLIKKHFDKNVEKVPQVFVPYKEVLNIYENGLQVPDDVTLMWCDDNYGYMTRLSDEEQQKRSGGAGVYYHLSYWGRPHDYMWLTTEQPGLIYNEMKQAYDHNARKLWIVNVHDPKVAAYQLELFLDMAWNINSISYDGISNHLKQWLQMQFGNSIGSMLLPQMQEYYRLCGIRRPEFMGWSQVELDRKRYPRGRSQVTDTEFTSAFGNETNRYLEDYRNIVDSIEQIGTKVPAHLKDAYFAAIKYPVYCASLMATKMLEAQKARSLCMGQMDNYVNSRHDALLTAASRSLKAYYDIRTLTEYYNNVMANGKWKGNMNFMPRDLNVFNGPILPIVPTEKEIEKYATKDKAHYPIKSDGAIAINAAEYSSATTNVKTIDMLGHSMKAVSIPKNGSISFDINIQSDLNGMLYTATIPTQANDKGDIRYKVTITSEDGKSVSEEYSLKEPFRSDRWKENVMRGQALRTMPINLKAGKHTITITALDEHILIDQLMLDNKTNRKFYVIPTKIRY